MTRNIIQPILISKVTSYLIHPFQCCPISRFDFYRLIVNKVSTNIVEDRNITALFLQVLSSDQFRGKHWLEWTHQVTSRSFQHTSKKKKKISALSVRFILPCLKQKKNKKICLVFFLFFVSFFLPMALPFLLLFFPETNGDESGA